MIHALAGILLSATCQLAQATNISAGVMDRKEHQDWESFEVRGPDYGMFILGRAATVAKKPSAPEATLVLSSSITNKFSLCEESAELIIERPKGDRSGAKRKSKIQMSVDGGGFHTLLVTETAAKGDHWIYMDIPKAFIQAL